MAHLRLLNFTALEVDACAPSTNMEGVGVMTYTTANHNGDQDFFTSLSGSCHVVHLYIRLWSVLCVFAVI